jgi:acetylglutamate kinase
MRYDMNEKPNIETSQQIPPSGGGGALFVIKIGGNIIDDETKLSSFLKQFANLFGNSPSLPFRGRGLLVHGGGKLATKLAKDLNIQQQIVDGRRITDAETLKIVTMVYAGYINKNIVAQLQSHNCNAIGLSGADGNIIKAHKRPLKNEIDYGFVGDVDEVNTNILVNLIEQNMAVVLAPVTHDENGQLLNTNADTIASSVAVALSTYYDVRLIYCFEKKGVLENVEDEHSVIGKINKEKYQQLLKEKKLFEGILPKIDNAFAAIDAGVKEVLIGDAKDLLKNVTDETVGTLIN